MQAMDEQEIERIMDTSREIKGKVLIFDGTQMHKLPQELVDFTWVEDLHIVNCGLESLENLPCNVIKVVANDNNITEVIGNDTSKVQELSLNNNHIVKFSWNNQNLKKVKLSGNYLNDTSTEFPDSLLMLLISKNKFTLFPKLGTNIKVLKISDNMLQEIDYDTKSCVRLDVCNNNIISVKKLPPHLIDFHADFNNISYLCNFPESIEEISLKQNELNILPKLPNVCRSCDVSYNNIAVVIEPIPSSLENFDITDNMLIINNPRYKYILKLKCAEYGEHSAAGDNDIDNYKDNDDDDDGYNTRYDNYREFVESERMKHVSDQEQGPKYTAPVQTIRYVNFTKKIIV